MEKRFYTVLDRQGRPVSGAAVEVRTWPFGELATIYSDDGATVKPNPTLTDENGYFEYYAPNGHYTWIITTNREQRIVNDVSHDDSLLDWLTRDWLTTGGTGTAYTLTPPYPPVAYVSGISYLVEFHTACGANPTLQISGLPNPPNLVKRLANGTLANIEAGDIPANWRSRVVLLSATQALVEQTPLTAGDIPTSALGSGTADSTTFLRGDRTWVSIPSGEIVIRNRGVVRSCTVTKSTTAVRNLNIAQGVCFAGGQTYLVIESANAAGVPDNTSSAAVVVSAYLYPHTDGQTYRLAVTDIGQAVPDNGIEIYRLTIPANNTGANDPYLANVTLTDVRRIEANFPDLLDSPPTVSLAFDRPMGGTDWRIILDVVSATGIARANDIWVGNRATNGCTLTLASAADDVRVRYLIERLTD